MHFDPYPRVDLDADVDLNRVQQVLSTKMRRRNKRHFTTVIKVRVGAVETQA